MSRVAGNYLWLDLKDVPIGAQSPYLLTPAPLRECDCFDALTVAFSYIKNAALAPITVQLTWYDEYKHVIFTELSTPISTFDGDLSFTTPIKGCFVSISILNSSTTYSVFSSIVAILVVY
jgi:hypothetical protein